MNSFQSLFVIVFFAILEGCSAFQGSAPDEESIRSAIDYSLDVEGKKAFEVDKQLAVV